MPLVLKSNSPDAQFDELQDAFAAIRQKAQDYEQHEKGTVAKLYATLADLYDFGEMARAIFDGKDRPLTQQFIEHRNGKWNKPAQGNPYIALLPYTFTDLSASLKSQYAQVLHHAHQMKVSVEDFRQWLMDKGIKARLEEAAEFANSTARQINASAKQSRLERAGSVLTSGPRSPSVAMPEATQHKGFATVLVEIDGSNNASILRLLDTDSSKIDPLLLKLVPTQATQQEKSAERPLGRLHRAIDLILGLTDAQGLSDYYLRIVNRMERGKATCHVDAVSTAYSFMWAGMVLEGHLPTLPIDHAVALGLVEAQDLQANFGRFDGWSIAKNSGDTEAYTLTATTPTHKVISLAPLSADKTFRMGAPIMKGQHGVSLNHAVLPNILAFIDLWRADTKRLNAQRKVLRNPPRRLAMNLNGKALQIVREDAPNIAADFLSTTRKTEFVEPRWLAITDVERICRTLSSCECDATGWFLNSDVADATIQFNVAFPADGDKHDMLMTLLPMVISNGMHYAQVCKEI
ncbi:hypothetical protein [Sphingobium lactosutens]|uniref:Uncharacterized protein n=1 Tax=Sphingobium lactosutens DS20 TaxID=1331060 RepID=T0H6J8_9SPHN|nr:hypothetical protein [Sphingobium lactosutens]EQB11936.1 hypothetical protein RLDS_22685 [Sphingobium lactosutens DS20]